MSTARPLPWFECEPGFGTRYPETTLISGTAKWVWMR